MKQNFPKFTIALFAIAVFLVADNLNYLTNFLELKKIFPAKVVLGFRNILEIACCFVALCLFYRFGIKKAAEELAFFSPFKTAAIFVLTASLPMLLIFSLTSKINLETSVLSVVVGCFLAPFAEEVLYRAFFFRQLYRRANFGFWISALLPSFFFGINHLYQSNDFVELLGIFAITGVGGLFFCWLFIRWQDNLWVIFGMHALMNLWWEIFAVDDTALGGWTANIARFLTVAAAIILTIYKDRIWKNPNRVNE